MRMLGFLRDHFPDSETYPVMANTGLSTRVRSVQLNGLAFDARTTGWN
jgi:hypothetical protein